MTESDFALVDRLVYVARPVDLISKEDGLKLAANLEDVEMDLLTSGATIYNPAGAFRVPPNVTPNGTIQRVNREAILAADALVACYPEHSIGVPMEMQFARDLGKPVAVHTDVAHRSWALADYTVADTSWDTWTTELGREIEGAEARRDLGDVLKFTGDPECAPTRGYRDDAGFDLYVSAPVTIPAGQVRDVPCGVNLELPGGTWGLVLGRSSTIRNHHLTVNPAVIDGGYRGPMFVAVHNTGSGCYLAERGQRLGQLIPLPNLAETLTAIAVPELSEGTRGDKGFGSSGA